MNHAANTTDKIYNALSQHVLFMFRLYDEFDLNKVFSLVIDDYIETAEVVAKNASSSYDEYGSLYFVFKVGSEFYKLDGYKGSYGGVEWENYLTKVDRREKVVYLYE